MSLVVELDFKSADEAKKYLAKGQSVFKTRLKTALMEAGLYMLKSIDTNFRVGGRPKWPALSAATVANRRMGSSNPLADTGRLKQSITTSSAMKQTNDTVSIGTNVEYARIHQFGGTIRIPEIVPKRANVLSWIRPDGTRAFATKVKAHTVKIPQRAFLLFQKEDIVMLEKVFLRHLDAAFQLKTKGGGK